MGLGLEVSFTVILKHDVMGRRVYRIKVGSG
jgi:hypothetical protein